jgi:hypothetical protein
MALNHLLTEKYLNLRNVKEAPGSEIAPDLAFSIIQRKFEIGNIGSVEITTHYGNMVLPMVEIWEQDGVLKISVDVSQHLDKL